MFYLFGTICSPSDLNRHGMRSPLPRECLETWLGIKNSCPLCRKQSPSLRASRPRRHAPPFVLGNSQSQSAARSFGIFSSSASLGHRRAPRTIGSTNFSTPSSSSSINITIQGRNYSRAGRRPTIEAPVIQITVAPSEDWARALSEDLITATESRHRQRHRAASGDRRDLPSRSRSPTRSPRVPSQVSLSDME